jgi:hypothetical protein
VRTRAPFLKVALLGAIVAACDRGPAGINQPRDMSPPQTAAFSAASSGAKTSPISGAIDFVGGEPAARFFATPSGRCHFFGVPTVTQFSGDVSGTVTFDEKFNAPCDFNNLVASGPFSGHVTWNDRTGLMSGQWNTNCVHDASQPVGLSCDGVMNARGSGDLEGVHFHFVWGPGWYPFPYSGTAFSD